MKERVGDGKGIIMSMTIGYRRSKHRKSMPSLKLVAHTPVLLSLALVLGLRVKSLALALKVKSLLTTLPYAAATSNSSSNRTKPVKRRRYENKIYRAVHLFESPYVFVRTDPAVGTTIFDHFWQSCNTYNRYVAVINLVLCICVRVVSVAYIHL